MLLKIGDFARIARVSARTLHHYDDIGLFQPAHVDAFTAYRYYTLEQLPRLNRILALRDLGLSLDQVRQIVDDNLSAEEMRGMLRMRRAQLQGDIVAAQAQLRQVDVRLRWIEHEGTMFTTEVLLKDVAALTVAGAREVVPMPAQMRERCIALDHAACQLIARAGLETDRVSLALYYGNSDAGIDVEMAYVVTTPGDTVGPIGGATAHTLPPARVAYAVYRGSYDDFAAVGQLHAFILEWIEDHHHTVSGAVREYYLQPPRYRTDLVGVMEIQYPIS
jgi:DNA-binding transcriptional MerR regulator